MATLGLGDLEKPELSIPSVRRNSKVKNDISSDAESTGLLPFPSPQSLPTPQPQPTLVEAPSITLPSQAAAKFGQIHAGKRKEADAEALARSRERANEAKEKAAQARLALERQREEEKQKMREEEQAAHLRAQQEERLQELAAVEAEAMRKLAQEEYTLLVEALKPQPFSMLCTLLGRGPAHMVSQMAMRIRAAMDCGMVEQYPESSPTLVRAQGWLTRAVAAMLRASEEPSIFALGKPSENALREAIQAAESANTSTGLGDRWQLELLSAQCVLDSVNATSRSTLRRAREKAKANMTQVAELEALLEAEEAARKAVEESLANAEANAEAERVRFVKERNEFQLIQRHSEMKLKQLSQLQKQILDLQQQVDVRQAHEDPLTSTAKLVAKGWTDNLRRCNSALLRLQGEHMNAEATSLATLDAKGAVEAGKFADAMNMILDLSEKLVVEESRYVVSHAEQEESHQPMSAASIESAITRGGLVAKLQVLALQQLDALDAERSRLQDAVEVERHVIDGREETVNQIASEIATVRAKFAEIERELETNNDAARFKELRDLVKETMAELAPLEAAEKAAQEERADYIRKHAEEMKSLVDALERADTAHRTVKELAGCADAMQLAATAQVGHALRIVTYLAGTAAEFTPLFLLHPAKGSHVQEASTWLTAHASLQLSFLCAHDLQPVGEPVGVSAELVGGLGHAAKAALWVVKQAMVSGRVSHREGALPLLLPSEGGGLIEGVASFDSQLDMLLGEAAPPMAQALELARTNELDVSSWSLLEDLRARVSVSYNLLGTFVNQRRLMQKTPVRCLLDIDGTVAWVRAENTDSWGRLHRTHLAEEAKGASSALGRCFGAGQYTDGHLIHELHETRALVHRLQSDLAAVSNDLGRARLETRLARTLRDQGQEQATEMYNAMLRAQAAAAMLTRSSSDEAELMRCVQVCQVVVERCEKSLPLAASTVRSLFLRQEGRSAVADRDEATAVLLALLSKRTSDLIARVRMVLEIGSTSAMDGIKTVDLIRLAAKKTSMAQGLRAAAMDVLESIKGERVGLETRMQAHYTSHLEAQQELASAEADVPATRSAIKKAQEALLLGESGSQTDRQQALMAAKEARARSEETVVACRAKLERVEQEMAAPLASIGRGIKRCDDSAAATNQVLLATEKVVNKAMGLVGQALRILNYMSNGKCEHPLLFLLHPAKGSHVQEASTWLTAHASLQLSFLCAHDLQPVGEPVGVSAELVGGLGHAAKAALWVVKQAMVSGWVRSDGGTLPLLLPSDSGSLLEGVALYEKQLDALLGDAGPELAHALELARTEELDKTSRRALNVARSKISADFESLHALAHVRLQSLPVRRLVDLDGTVGFVRHRNIDEWHSSRAAATIVDELPPPKQESSCQMM